MNKRNSQPKIIVPPPIVSKSNNGTVFESDVSEFLNSLGILNIEYHKKLSETLTVSFYFPDKQVAIYCADSKVEYEIGPHFARQVSKRHEAIDRWYEAKALGIRLIWLQDFVWAEKRSKIEQVIHNALLPSKTIYARTTEAVKLDHKLAQEFCNLYHIDGCAYIQQYSVGLVMKGDSPSLDSLLQVMTFSGRRYSHFDNGQNWECARMCVKPEITVVGGTSKMFSKFVKDCKPRAVLSFSANSWFSGSGYDKIGFETVGDSGPSYQWVSFHGNLEPGTALDKPQSFWDTDTSGPTRIARESVQSNKHMALYPDLGKDVLENPDNYPVSGIENQFCSYLGLYKCHNAGNSRHMIHLWYDNDPRVFEKSSEKDIMTLPYHCGEYSDPKFDINRRMTELPAEYVNPPLQRR